MIAREQVQQLSQAVKEFPAVTLVGPRQSGKTTLLRTLFPHASYVHLEESDILAFAKRDPRGFVQAYKEPVIFDEVQYAPELVPYIKSAIDRNRNRRGRFFLTGSQNFQLMETMSESLAGRTAYITLMPCSYSEAAQLISQSTIEQLCFHGFFPETIADPIWKDERSVSRWQASYIRNFIERDIRKIGEISDLNRFERFVGLTAGRTAQLLNLSDLGRDATIKQPTARRWLTLLEAGYLVFELLPFHKNFSKRLVKSPKLYFWDVGLCRYLLGLREMTQLRVNQSFGALFETLVIADIRKTMIHNDSPLQTSFYRSSDGIEVDLILHGGGQMHAIEIKANATPTLDQVENLRQWLKLTKTTQAYVLCLVDQPQPLGDGITAFPWWQHAKIWR